MSAKEFEQVKKLRAERPELSLKECVDLVRGKDFKQSEVVVSRKLYGKLVHNPEGVVREHKFKTEAETAAYVLGVNDAKEQSSATDDDPLEDYFACADDQPAKDEA